MRHSLYRYLLFVLIFIGILALGSQLTYAAIDEPGPGDPTTPPPSETTPPPSETTPPPSETTPPPSETTPPPSETTPPPSETTPPPSETTPPDDDGDGIPNVDDLCPNVYGISLYDGCPLPDDDRDGVPNSNDWCANQAGVPENNGCPAPTPAPVSQVRGDSLGDTAIERAKALARQGVFALNRTPQITPTPPPVTSQTSEPPLHVWGSTFAIGIGRIPIRTDTISLTIEAPAPQILVPGSTYPMPYFEGSPSAYMDTNSQALLVTAFDGVDVIRELDPRGDFIQDIEFEFYTKFVPVIWTRAFAGFVSGDIGDFTESTSPRGSVALTTIIGSLEIGSELIERETGYDFFESPFESNVNDATEATVESDAFQNWETNVRDVRWPEVIEAEGITEDLQKVVNEHLDKHPNAELSLSIFSYQGTFYLVLVDPNNHVVVTTEPVVINEHFATMMTEETVARTYRLQTEVPTPGPTEPTYTETPSPYPTTLTPVTTTPTPPLQAAPPPSGM